MTPSMKNAILFACLKAIEALGDGYKGMSCFLYNWKQAKSPVYSHGQNKKAA